MKAAVWQGDTIAIDERPTPTTAPGSALLRVDLTGLCGTDLAITSGHHQRARPPLILGHEMIGTVEAVDGDGPAAGTRVAVNPLLPCHQCWPCRHRLSHTCRNLHLIGIDRDGSLAELVSVPAQALTVLPAGTPLPRAALVEPLAVAHHALGQSRLQPGHTVMIFGAGPIGILTGLLAQAAGAGPLLVAEPNPERRAIAASLGMVALDASGPAVAEAVLEHTAGAGADVTFDTAGHPSVPPLLSSVTREHGTIVMAGLHHQPAALDLHALAFTEQRLIGSRVYTGHDFAAAVAAVGDDQLGLDRLPIRVFPLPEAAAALSAASTHPGAVKIMVASH